MSALSSLLRANVPSESLFAQQKAYVTYCFPLDSSDASTCQDRQITLLESRSVISSSGTTGLRTWEAALLLGAFLLSETGQAMVCGQRILELGTGTGMLSILCAKYLGASGVVATDGDEGVVDAVKTNAFLNGLDDPSRATFRSAVLKWGWPIKASGFEEDYGMSIPDVVVAADVVSAIRKRSRRRERSLTQRLQTYDESVIPALVSSLRGFYELNPGLRVLIGATIRNPKTIETFLGACGGFAPQNQPRSRARSKQSLMGGVDRNGLRFDEVDFPARPEHLQDGPFYPTWTPIKIWCITRSQADGELFGV